MSRGGEEERTMICVLLLGQVGFFKVIIRQTHGRLHHQSPSILNLMGTIGQPLSRICLKVGRLEVWVLM